MKTKGVKKREKQKQIRMLLFICLHQVGSIMHIRDPLIRVTPASVSCNFSSCIKVFGDPFKRIRCAFVWALRESCFCPILGGLDKCVCPICFGAFWICFYFVIIMQSSENYCIFDNHYRPSSSPSESPLHIYLSLRYVSVIWFGFLVPQLLPIGGSSTNNHLQKSKFKIRLFLIQL